MGKNKRIKNKYGDEAPTPKEFLMVILVVALLIAFAWIAYYKFGWFH
jgi:hypothetical protein